jgi:hypothetical protein
MILSLSSAAGEQRIAYMEGWMIGIGMLNVKDRPIVFHAEVV